MISNWKSPEEQATQFTALAERAKKAGHQLIETQGGFMLRRWCYSKHVEKLDDVAALLERMTGRAAQ